MKGKLSVLVLAAGVGLAGFSAQAGTIGYCVVAGGSSCQFSSWAANTITATGNTPVALTGLAAGDLTGLSVLWILNGNNGNPGTIVTDNTAAIAAFVAGGGVLSFHDRNVDQGISAATYIPGAGSVSFTNSFSTNIDIVTPGTGVTNGPFGTITDTTLDGGNFSDHGYADLASLPAGAVPIFSNGNGAQIVDFYYRLGSGAVYYSTIPLDFYLAGGGNNPPAGAMVNIYAPNEVAFEAGLGSPEPGTMLLLGGSLLALGGLLRRTRK